MPWVEVKPQKNTGAVADTAKSGAGGVIQGSAANVGFLGDIQGVVRRGVTGAVSGAANMFGADPAVAKSAGDAINALLSVRPNVMASPMNGGTTREIVNALPNTLASLGNYQPQTAAGEYAHTIGQFAPSALLPAGKDSLAKRAATTAAAAISSETAGQATKGTKFEAPARLVGAVVGGVASGAAMAPKAVKAQPQNALAQRIAEYDAAGVRPSLAASNKTAAGAAKMVSENMLAGGSARNNMAGQLDDMAASVSGLAQKYGQPTSRDVVGATVQKGVTGYTDRFTARLGRSYDQTLDQIEQSRQMRTANAKLDASLARPGGAPKPPARVVEPSSTRALLGEFATRNESKALEGLFSAPVLERVKSAVRGGDLSFQDLRDMRTAVRLAQKDPALASTIPSGMLQRMEGSLTADIYKNAEMISGKAAADKLRSIDGLYTKGMERINGALQAFMGKGNALPAERAYDLVVQAATEGGGANVQRLTQLRRALKPDEWGEVSATVLDRMGQPTPGSVEQGFSVSRFVTNANKLTPQGKSLLFGNGELRKSMDRLLSIGGDLKTIEAAANSSRSGVTTQNVGSISALSAGATAAALGHPLPLVGAGAGLGVMRLTGSALTNPKVVRAVAGLAQAAKQGRAATGAYADQLKIQMKSLPELAPLYEQALVISQSSPAIAPSPAR